MAVGNEADLLELRANPKKPARGTVLEASVSEGHGVQATVLVQDGMLRQGDPIVAGRAFGRGRRLRDENGQSLAEAGPSTPVIVSGLSEVPEAGDPFNVVASDDDARRISEERDAKFRRAAQTDRKKASLDTLFAKLDSRNREVRLVLKCDVKGSVEALRDQLVGLTTPEVRVKLLHAAVGAITESDVTLAEASDGIVLGFRVVPEEAARALALERGVEIRRYDIIYDLLDDVKKALEGLLEPEKKEVLHARVEVRKTFRFSKIGTIAGCYVSAGAVERSHRIRLVRDGAVVLPDAKIESLRRFEKDVREVQHGFECGLKIAGYDDVKPGDVIEAYAVQLIKRSLEAGKREKAEAR